MDKHCTVQKDNCEMWNYEDGFSLGAVLLNTFNSTRFWRKEKGNTRFLSAHRLKTEYSVSHGNSSVTLWAEFTDDNSVTQERVTLRVQNSERVIKKAKKQRYCRLIAESDKEIKTRRKNKIRDRGITSNWTDVICIYKQRKIRVSRNSCQYPQYFFLTIIENLKLPKVGREYAISLQKGTFPWKFFNINIILTNRKWDKKHKALPHIRTLIRYNGITSKIMELCTSLAVH
jgi:hypothetical protein